MQVSECAAARFAPTATKQIHVKMTYLMSSYGSVSSDALMSADMMHSACLSRVMMVVEKQNALADFRAKPSRRVAFSCETLRSQGACLLKG